MNFDDLRRRADAVRTLPLETVLLFRGAVRDRHDKSKWHTDQGPLSVSDPKFMNWRRGQAGGGAIDLVMHLDGVDFRTAVAWLQQHLAASSRAIGEPAAHAPDTESSVPKGPGTLRLPVPDDRMLGRVRQYLTRRRPLEASLIEPLIQAGKLYADSRGNAVFLLVAGKAQRPVGAELRGTGPRIWRGMAPGTRKDLGYFWIGVHGSREIVLCESAIDAMSLFPDVSASHLHLHLRRSRRSSLATRTDCPWLRTLLRLRCGRPWRRRSRPDDGPTPRSPPITAARPRLERRPHLQPLAAPVRKLPVIASQRPVWPAKWLHSRPPVTTCLPHHAL